MHSCTETQERITELLLDGADRCPDDVLLAELRGCAECRSEFDALNATLRATRRLKETVAPAESYWTGYHARLRQKVENLAGESDAKAQMLKRELSLLFAALRLCVKTAVPVPVPVIIAVILAAVGLFVMLAARQPTPQTPLIVNVPVEVPVPVVQEKVVTRVVYRERRSPRRMIDAPKVNSTFAKSQNAEIPASLIGFKPTEEVKLTVIKGGSQNEK